MTRRSPRVRILLRADSGFAREELMRWCEWNAVDYVFGLAKNHCLNEAIAVEPSNWSRPANAPIRPASRPAGSRTSLWPPGTAGAANAVSKCYRQGRMDPRRRQPALYRDLLVACRTPGPSSLREGLLRPRRHGEPHQGMPARPVRRSHLGQDDARQPSCAGGSRRCPMRWFARCTALPSSKRSSPRPPAAPSVASYSRSTPWCGSVSAGSRSRCPPAVPAKTSSPSPTRGCAPRRADDPGKAEQT